VVKSLADEMVDESFDVLMDVYGVSVSYRFREAPTEDFDIRGIFDRLGVITKVVDGFPSESKAVTCSFRKADFTEAGKRQPAQGDTIAVPDEGIFSVFEISSDDGIEITCVLREVKNA